MTTKKILHKNYVAPCLLTALLAAMILLMPANGAQPDYQIPNPHPLMPHQTNAVRGPFWPEPKIIIDSDRLTQLANTNHIELIEWALQTYRKRVRDYSATFYKQERINGKLKKTEQIAVMFREKPFSIFMHWQKNAARIDKMLFVEGQNNNKMVVHPTGFFAWFKSVKKDPTGKEAKNDSLRTCDQFGFHRSMDSLLDLYNTASKKGDLISKYLGHTKIDNRPCLAIERTLPQGKGYPNARTVIEIDLEYLLPVSVTFYNWDNQLLAKYTFLDLKFNNGYTNAKFTPKYHGM
jgi:outer membrane lipoprotein-sorting protein